MRVVLLYRLAGVAAALLLAHASPTPAAEPDTAKPAPAGFLPTDAQGKPLNLDFERGTLQDWKAEGDAFSRQPVEGDTVYTRRQDMHSRHQGRYWVGSFERSGDAPKGTLTSAPFRVAHRYARFLVAGGSTPATRVELVRSDTNEVIYRVSGDDTEDLKPVAVDLGPHLNKDLRIRLVDDHSGGWGHINFDDFRLFDQKPEAPERPQAQAWDVYQHEGLAPAEAAAAMTVPEGFHVTLFAGEPDVVQPIAFAVDDRGRVWVAEAYSYPRRVAPDKARDRILIFEDKDGDGHFDTRKVFTEGLNLVSGLQVGFGGVWVGAAPEFMFIPDRDGDDKPDGPPQVLLDGWGSQDTHETLNSFTWGPDGWLYGCHGVFTHSNVGKPGTPEDKRTELNAGIWRYHPTRHEFEVFAEGTSNPWGIDYDRHGQAFLTACVIPHLYHIIQGGRYERQAGPHVDPYTYDDLKTIADHRHWLGTTPHSGNGKSDAAGGGHAHAGALIYQGAAWPEEYRGSLFMNNIHGARLNRDTLEPKGSGFVGHHAPDFLLANDRWSQVVSLRPAPDGGVYMIDWYDKNQCHRNEIDVHDRTNGRIFKISYNGTKPVKADLRSLASAELVKLQLSENDWFAREARRILQERGPDEATRKAIATTLLNHGDAVIRLRGLWTLHVISGLDDSTITTCLTDADPYVRAWTIQLATERSEPRGPVLAMFAVLAASDPSPVVRLYLASVLQRLPEAKRWAIAEALVKHAEDAGDHNLPLMNWYAVEPLAEVDTARALRLATSARLPNLLPFMVRRIGAIGTPEAYALLVDGLKKAASDDRRLAFLQGMNESLKGRRSAAMPAAWPAVFTALAQSKNPQIASEATALGLTFGDATALKSLRGVLANGAEKTELRQRALEALLKVQDAGLAPTLRKLLSEPALRAPALRGLARYDDADTPPAILALYAQLTPGEKRDALATLAAREPYARALLTAVGAKRVPATDLSADLIRQLRSHKSQAIDEEITKVWGRVRETGADKAKLIARYKAMIKAPYSGPNDPSLGRAIFTKTCQQCHTLFGTGAKVGPELTGSNRADLDYILANVLDPSALIGNDYQAHTIATTDGRVLTGLIKAEDKDAITLVTATETVTIPKPEVEARKKSDASMMPDDLWTPLKDQEIRALVAYLASAKQVPILATADNVSTFFNGRDFTGWEGDSELWHVENGEIVGRTPGLKRNEFLRSDMTMGDFRLTVQVKLVKNEGNSGIQFRSESLPEGEVRGYQADVGAGWWGKIYEENGRGLLWDKSGEEFVKNGEWNTYEIVAVGPTIRTSINGHPCAKLDDPSGARRGIVAFQLHSGGATEVRYKDFHLELNPKIEAK